MKPVQLARLHTRDIFSFRCRVSVHVSTLKAFTRVHSTRVQVRAGGVAGAAAAG